MRGRLKSIKKYRVKILAEIDGFSGFDRKNDQKHVYGGLYVCMYRRKSFGNYISKPPSLDSAVLQEYTSEIAIDCSSVTYASLLPSSHQVTADM
tara:strand:- start:265 stop:546 length:282 start_codon:yes stop_codon:yes gene_type:complete